MIPFEIGPYRWSERPRILSVCDDLLKVDKQSIAAAGAVLEQVMDILPVLAKASLHAQAVLY